MRLLTSQYGRGDGMAIRAAAINPIFLELPPTELYGLLWRYYLNNSLYEDTTQALRELNRPSEDIRELRNPAHRVVEFHVAKAFPGTLPSALPLLAERSLVAPIRTIWRWSNLTQTKQRWVRFCATFGDSFLKIAERETPQGREVFLQVLDPRWVTDFHTDELGNVTYIRIDVPQREIVYERGPFGIGGRTRHKAIMYTEVWDTRRIRIYRHPQGAVNQIRPLDDIPATEDAITDRDEEHDLGFVPVVWAPFYDIGEGRGMGAFTHVLSKIDEANRICTRLHALLFRNNNNNWVLRANQIDSTGRPLPPPRLDGLDGSTSDDRAVQLGDERVWRLPGQSELQSIIPSIDYNAALSILNATLEELRNDLPELRYYDSTAKSHVSGTALRYALADAADRVLEARGNLEAALLRAHSYALHIAQRAGLRGFEAETIGRLADGDFEHQFAERPVFPLTSAEQAQAVIAWVQAGIPLPVALVQEGWTDEEVESIREAQLADVRRAIEVQAMQQRAATELPLTDEQIAAVAVNYSKQVSVPLELALERLGWSREWIERLKEAQQQAQQQAQEQQQQQQEQALAQQQQAQEQAMAMKEREQNLSFEQQRQLQAERLAAQERLAGQKAAAKPAPAPKKPG